MITRFHLFMWCVDCTSNYKGDTIIMLINAFWPIRIQNSTALWEKLYKVFMFKQISQEELKLNHHALS